jgi:hypothetical protein
MGRTSRTEKFFYLIFFSNIIFLNLKVNILKISPKISPRVIFLFFEILSSKKEILAKIPD